MKLDRIEITGFRGIKRLSLAFDDLSTLIGENAWGKSSLLDALSVSFPPDNQPYMFTKHDFHLDHATSHSLSSHLQIVTRWIENYPDEHKAGRYRKLHPLWCTTKSNKKKSLHYRLSATLSDNKVETHHVFLDHNGDIIPTSNTDALVKELVGLHPVIRLRDSRRLQDHHSPDQLPNSRMERRINNTCRRLISTPGHVNDGEIRSSMNAMESLIDHYFAFKPHNRQRSKQIHDGLYFGRMTEGSQLRHIVAKGQNKQIKLLLLGLLNAYLRAKGPTVLRRSARPILLIEDPEGRLHPTLLSQAWSLLLQIPMQKILTTNSSDLLTTVPLSSLRRLIRESDRTIALSINNKVLSNDELRRITFHVRFHRPGALFARCWLLVEGETEVWLFNELGRICGYNFAAEGVQIIEFAQSGLRSLIKIAKALHIDWHVVSDGDAAGKKYSHTARCLLGTDQERHRLTQLPDKDIEHFLYKNGFESLFRKLANISPDHVIPAKKVITKALKKHAKPDVALGIVEYSEQNGVESIPLLIRWILKRVVTMAKGNT